MKSTRLNKRNMEKHKKKKREKGKEKLGLD